MWRIKCEYLLMIKISEDKEMYFCEKKQKTLVSSRQCACCQKCEHCVQDKALCSECTDNFAYATMPRISHFCAYIPVCPRGYQDCVCDPAYIFFHYPDWYKELYGDLTPEEAIHTEDGCYQRFIEDPDMIYYCYDDEDK